MSTGLFDPLGRDRAPRPKTPGPTLPVAVAVLAVAALAGLIGVAYLRDNGDRGRPTAISTIDHTVAVPKPVVPIPSPPPSPPPGLAKGDDDVEIQNGVRIIRPHRDRYGTGGDVIAIPNRIPADTATGH